MTELASQSLLAQINNPALGNGLQGLNGVQFFQRLLPALVGIGFVLGVIIFFFVLLIGAISWITSGGDKAALESARSRVFNAIIGLVVLFVIFAIINLLEIFFSTNIVHINLGPLIISGGGGGPGGCFLAGTKVKLADGTSVEIQEIKPGDIVYSYNLKAGALVADKVLSVKTHTDYPGGYLIINEKLKVTGNHRMWVVNKNKWGRADSLTLGDKLLNSQEEEISIDSIEKVDGKNTVYNLHLRGGDHNYFAEDFLVHNYKIP